MAAGGDLEALASGDGGLSAGTFGADQDLSNEVGIFKNAAEWSLTLPDWTSVRAGYANLQGGRSATAPAICRLCTEPYLHF